MASDALDAEFLFTLTAELGDASHAMIRNGPAGTRFIVPVSGGHFEGPRLKGTIVPPGGDWVQSRPDRSARLDVRLQLVTDDGTPILMTYQGIGMPGEDGSTDIRTAPTFEAPEGDHAWLNTVQAVGIGSASGASVTYRIYALL